MTMRDRTSVSRAAFAGFVGTVAMTLAMAAMHRRLPPEQQGPLPPRQITMAAAEHIRMKDRMAERSRFTTTMVLHFGYGTAVGAFYAPLGARAAGPAWLKGMAFGVLVWIFSYLGWVPIVGLLSPATRHPAERNCLMITAHLIWGAVIAAVTETMSEGSRTTARAPR
jgi:uncharacterized membrane protein YagU involved in acid resistance